jgi:hypothetical protein
LLVELWLPRVEYRVRYRQCPIDEAEFVLMELASDDTQFELCTVTRMSVLPNLRPKTCRCSAIRRDELPPLEERMLVFRHKRYLYNKDTREFEPLHLLQQMPPNRIRERASAGMLDGSVLPCFLALKKLTKSCVFVCAGLSVAEHGDLLDRYGRNELDITVESYGSLLLREVTTPFLMFQLFSIVLWCIEEYFVFAGGTLLYTLILSK